MKRKDYIPRKEAEFDHRIENIMYDVSENYQKWNIKEDAYTPFVEKHQRWKDAYHAAGNKEKRSQTDVAEKNEAKKDLTAFLRKFVNEHLVYNTAITDVEKESMGLNIRPANLRSRVPVPQGIPEVSIDTSIHLQHKVHFINAETGKKAKPHGVTHCEIWCKKGEIPPVNESELVFLGVATRTPFLASFPLEDGGKTAHYMLRWVNTRGENGPWSVPVNATIGK